MTKKNKIYLGVVCLVIFAIALFVWAGGGFSKKEHTSGKPKIVQVPVTVEQVQLRDVVRHYETSGTIKAGTVSKVAPKVMGEVTAIYFKAGDRVEAGQVLAELRDENLQQKALAADAGMREAQKGLELALRTRTLQKNTHTRYEELYRQGAISLQQVDEVRTQSDLAELACEQAQAALERATAMAAEVNGYSRLIAPVSGVVTEKNMEKGTMALPGIWAVVVEDNSSFLVECYVDGVLSSQIQTGLEVIVDVDGIGHALQGKVQEIVPSVDTASRSFLIKVLITDPVLKSGLYCKVRFPIGIRKLISVPQESLVEKGQLLGVYILDGEKRFWYRMVRTGEVKNDQVEIVSGLQVGDYVVVKGAESVMDGAFSGKVEGL